MVVQNQIKRTLSRELDRLHAVMRREKFAHRTALADRVCSEFGFHDARGRAQRSGCLKALRELEARGRIRLPTPRRRVKHCGPRGLGRAVPEPVGVPETVDGVRELELIAVETGPQRALWNELMAREHPRGAGPLVGAQLRYLVGSAHGWLGGLGFGAAALRLRDRDRWIGWDEEQRRAHLHRVVGLSRFLIRPSVRCRNLASRVLGEVLRRLGPEFQARYGYRPWLVETFVETARHDGASLRATNWRVLGKTQGRGRQDRAHRGAETSKAIYGYELCRDWRRRLGVGPAPRRGVEPMSEGEGLEGEGWAQQELGGAPLGDRRLSRRLVESAHRQAQEPGRAFTGVARGDPAAVKGYYRLIDQPEASAVTVSNILAPHRERTRQRMQGQRTVLCIQDGSDLNFTRHGRCEGLGVIGRNQTGATARGLHLHATLVVSETGLPLGVLRAKLDAPKPGPVATRKKKKTYRWIEGLRDCAEVSRSLDGVRVVSVVDREADFFALFAEQRASPEVELLVRAKQDRVLKRKTRAKAAGKSADPDPEQKRKLFGRLRSAPVRARMLLEVKRQSARIKASKQAARPRRLARVARMELRYETLTIPAPRGNPTGIPSLRLSVVHAREVAPPADGKRLEWFLLTTLPVTDVETAQQLLRWYALRWRVEDYFRVLKTGCRVQQLQHQTAERLKRAIAMHAVIAWRIMLMTLLGREDPDLPAQLLFSDLEIRVLGAFAASRRYPPPEDLGAAVLVLARLGGYLARKHDPPPGHQLLWQGYVTLYGMCLGFALREET